MSVPFLPDIYLTISDCLLCAMNSSSSSIAKYEYMDNVSVDSELICIICNKPFADPVSTPCDHTFCRGCISHWIEKKKKSCPTCRSQIKSVDQCTQVSRPLRNMLDRLPVKCSTCGQTEIPKESFSDHISKLCPKMNVLCSAADIKCPWNGLRDELSKHLSSCRFEPLRAVLAQLITTNEQLTKESQLLTNELKQLYEQTKVQNVQINELTNKLSTLTNVLPVLEEAPECVANSIIDYSNQKITDRELSTLAVKMLAKPYATIQLHGNAITSAGLATLASVLANHSTTLTDLWLSNNCISDAGVRSLIESYLSKNSTLKQLHLGSNCITSRGLHHIACLLEYNNTLTDLWLYNNQIDDDGVGDMATVLRSKNRTLQHLNLQWNKLITDRSIEFLLKALENNPTLNRLNLRNCNLSVTGKVKLLQAISSRKDFKLYI